MIENNDYRKKALCIASVASNLDNFNRSNVDILLNLGYEVTLAANFHTKEDINSQEKIDEFAKEMRGKGVHIVQIDFSRKIKKIGYQLKSMIQVRQLLGREFDLIHCHSPICAAIVRAEAQKYRKKNNTKVFYTAHGFHFYRGASLKNWLVFFPVEWMCSHWTDVLIMINKEDYHLARRWMKAKKIVYVPGVGVDLTRFQNMKIDRTDKRKELGIKQEDILLLSVGELNKNKNHEMVIRALAQISNPKLHYMIAGQGCLLEYLKDLATKLGIADKVHLLGYRTDVASLYYCSDIYVLPSIREGLNVSLMEAMASGLPCIVSKIRGNVDLIVDGKGGFLCEKNEVKDYVTAIKKLSDQIGLRNQMGRVNMKGMESFSNIYVRNQMGRLY